MATYGYYKSIALIHGPFLYTAINVAPKFIPTNVASVKYNFIKQFECAVEVHLSELLRVVSTFKNVGKNHVYKHV